MASNSAFQESADNIQRRERAVIAAQACQTCRNRKSKCDEQRPKCGLCQRLDVDCVYREPLPTKKDKTMVHILDTLARLETKFDNLALANRNFTPETTASEQQTVTSNATTSSRPLDHSESDCGTEEPEPSHLTMPHKALLWPSIYIYLTNSGIEAAADLQDILRQGTQWFINLEMASNLGQISVEPGLQSAPIPVDESGRSSSTRVAFPSLTMQRIGEYIDAYFDKFNIILPILDKDYFIANIFNPVMQHGYGYGDTASVIVLLILALGQVAIEGIFDEPISMPDGVASGLRGGTADRPPGIEIFNEARRRTGFLSSQMTLDTVQISLLEATYFGATASHIHFWRSTVMASMACQVLVKCHQIDWQSQYGGMVKRVFWSCNLAETFYHIDLDLPPSGIRQLEDSVPLPYFQEGQGASSPDLGVADERSHFQYQFLAMIALKRLISRIHEIIQDSFSSQSESTQDYRGPPITVIRELARQLDSWRTLLPRLLQWHDADHSDFSNAGQTIRRSSEGLFAPRQGHAPIEYRHNLDVMTAQLRSRYYHARFMLHRPFIYKALHFPELMVQEDVEFCVVAIKSAILWPMSMAPPKDKKRLVPDLFAWSQNFIAILLILRMTSESACLNQICSEYINRDDLQTTVSLMLEWVRDVSQVDATAAWGWKVLKPLYKCGL